MSRDIREGRWLQLRGRARLAWARFVGDAPMAADANAEVVTGALQESYGVAKKETLREVAKGIDAIAAVAKRTARALDK
jgi:uncharacterized protein YjbJ (UPF0337 family)